MRQWLLMAIGLLGVFFTLPGCGPAVSKSDLGRVVYEVPDVPGAEKEYNIPDVGDLRAAQKAEVPPALPGKSPPTPPSKSP